MLEPHLVKSNPLWEGSTQLPILVPVSQKPGKYNLLPCSYFLLLLHGRKTNSRHAKGKWVRGEERSGKMIPFGKGTLVTLPGIEGQFEQQGKIDSEQYWNEWLSAGHSRSLAVSILLF